MTQRTTAPPAERLLRFTEVRDMVAFGRTKIYGLVKAGKFPPPRRPCGTRSSRWLLSEVQAWIAKQSAPVPV